MATDPALRARPSRALMAGLAQQLAPNASISGVRMLGGGIDAGTHAFDLRLPEGVRRKLVLRRFDPRWLVDDRDRPLRMWHALELLERLGNAAPRPVWFDGAGVLFGVPTLVMTREPGRPLLAPRDPLAWGRQLGEALADVHAGAVTEQVRAVLRPARYEIEADMAWDERRTRYRKHPDGADIVDAIERLRPLLAEGRRVIVHGDYWPGNTLWRRGRLLSVIDWDGAAIGDPESDAAYARLDPFILEGPEAAAAVLAGYERRSGRVVQHLAFWELVAASHFLPDPPHVIDGYHDLGRTDITPDVMNERFREFVRSALNRLG